MPLTGEYAPSTVHFARKQVELFESTNGAEGNTVHGLPIIVLATLGAKSGMIRKTPLMRVEFEGQYLVVASNSGSSSSPSWYNNILSAPLVELQDGEVRKDYAPRRLFGDERSIWWARAVGVFPQYAEYQSTADREIPVFLLAPLD